MADMAGKTVDQLAYVQRVLQDLREELARHALTGVVGAGFQSPEMRDASAMMVLIGAARLCATSGGRGHYIKFQALCAQMAQTPVEKVMGQRFDLGPMQ